MYKTSTARFDEIALQYDEQWSSSPIGVLQRSAFWKVVDPLFRAGDRVLDLGCGTGVDALHFKAAGIHVYGIDSSAKMAEVAQSRGVDAHCHRIEDLNRLRLRFDGAISNFGALNCVESLEQVATGLARLIRPAGHVALCFLGRVCSWEIGYYLSRRNPRKAFRRLGGKSHSELAGNVFYFSSKFIVSRFKPHFRLRRRYGIGLCIPPSYVRPFSQRTMTYLSGFDSRLARMPVLRSLSDHSLYIFERL